MTYSVPYQSSLPPDAFVDFPLSLFVCPADAFPAYKKNCKLGIFNLYKSDTHAVNQLKGPRYKRGKFNRILIVVFK